MSQRVYLHIGAPKTGTSFLQAVLLKNRAKLRRDGMLVPGQFRNGHVAETLDLRQMAFKGHHNTAAPGAWGRAVAEIRAYDRSAIIDQEILSGANPEQIAKALSDLSFAEVHLVYTARDMARQVTASWQEWIKNRETTTYADFLTSARDPEAAERRTGTLFLRLHDTAAVLAKWTQDLPAERVHVITVPPPGADPTILWERFCSVIGIDAQRYDTKVTRANASLGATEATVLRRVNVELGGDQFPWPIYDKLVKHTLAPLLGQRRGDKIDLPEHAYEWALESSQSMAKYIADAGFEVIGDLDELVPQSRPTGIDPDAAPAGAQADAAVAGLAGFIASQSTGSKQFQRHVDDLQRRLTAFENELTRRRDMTPRQRIATCIAELSHQVRWLGALRSLYRRIRPAPKDVGAGVRS